MIKKAAKHGNFKNVCYTIAKRSQHALCYYLNYGEHFLDSTITVSKTCTEVLLVNESKEMFEHINSLHLNSQTIVHPTWIKYDFLLLKRFATLEMEKYTQNS